MNSRSSKAFKMNLKRKKSIGIFSEEIFPFDLDIITSDSKYQIRDVANLTISVNLAILEDY